MAVTRTQTLCLKINQENQNNQCITLAIMKSFKVKDNLPSNVVKANHEKMGVFIE